MNDWGNYKARVDAALDAPEVQAAARQLAPIYNLPATCPENCACQQDDAMTTPLDLQDVE